MFGRRKRFLVDRLQIELLAVQWAYFVAFGIVFVGAIFLPVVLRIRDERLRFWERNEAAAQFLALDSYLWPALAVLLILMTLHSVRFSHRIAGPFVRVRRAFAQLASKDLSVRVMLRRKDYFVREASAMNLAIASLAEGIGKLQRESAKLESQVSSLDRQIAEGDWNQVRGAIAAVVDRTRAVAELSREFKLDGASMASSESAPQASTRHRPSSKVYRIS